MFYGAYEGVYNYFGTHVDNVSDKADNDSEIVLADEEHEEIGEVKNYYQVIYDELWRSTSNINNYLLGYKD